MVATIRDDLTINSKNEYFWDRRQDDAFELGYLGVELAQTPPGDNIWKPLAEVMARIAVNSNVCSSEIICHVIDAITKEKRGEFDPVLATMENVFGAEVVS